MQTLTQIFQSQTEVKKSTFISFLCPFVEFKNLLQNLKNQHPKAVHFVYAYRILNELNQAIENKSDDQEPKGTAGMPLLSILRAYELINAAVIVVRYFGGIKLGRGGLVKAYSEAASAVIYKAVLIPFELKKQMQISIELKNLGRFEHFFKSNFLKFQREFKDKKVILKFHLNENEEQKFESFCKDFEPLEKIIL